MRGDCGQGGFAKPGHNVDDAAREAWLEDQCAQPCMESSRDDLTDNSDGLSWGVRVKRVRHANVERFKRGELVQVRVDQIGPAPDELGSFGG